MRGVDVTLRETVMTIAIRSALMAGLALCAFTVRAEFKLQDATIDSIHAGIRSGDVTCTQIVEAYVARAKAYNGVCSKLVTADGAKVAGKIVGTTRAGAPLKFPMDTIAVGKHIPDF